MDEVKEGLGGRVALFLSRGKLRRGGIGRRIDLRTARATRLRSRSPRDLPSSHATARPTSPSLSALLGLRGAPATPRMTTSPAASAPTSASWRTTLQSLASSAHVRTADPEKGAFHHVRLSSASTLERATLTRNCSSLGQTVEHTTRSPPMESPLRISWSPPSVFLAS